MNRRAAAAATTPANAARETAIVLVVGMVVRLAVLLMLPRDAIAFDLHAWSEVAVVLADGQNPYNEKPFLSWPPAWMQIIFVLDHLAHRLDVPLAVVIRAFLILADGVVILLTSVLIRRMAPVSVLVPLLVGWSLNPVAIILVCQHGSFDGLVAICVVAMLLSLISFAERRDPVSWLWACFWMGVGVVVKTVPITLAPLLRGGRRLSRTTLALGSALTLGPAVYGLSVLYVLGPAQIQTQVIGYRSFPGWFGVSGLLAIAGKRTWLPIYSTLFALGMVAAMVLIGRRLRRCFSAPRCLAAAAGLLVAIPALGPGYGPQYIGWFLPLLLAVYCVGSENVRRAVVGFGAVAVVTYVLEYALLPSHGAFLLAGTQHPSIVRLSQQLATERGATLARLPLFAAYLVLLVHLMNAALRKCDDASTGPNAGFHAERA